MRKLVEGIYGGRWSVQEVRLALRVAMALIALVCMLLGSDAGTQWE
jgi:hypothetical protein